MIRKLLFLCMLLLTSVGVWAQEATIELYPASGSGAGTQESPLLVDVNNTSGVKIWVKATGTAGYNVVIDDNDYVNASSFSWEGNWEISGTNGNFTVTPQKVGTGKITAKVKVGEDVKASTDLWIQVADATLATSLAAPASSATVAPGYSTVVPFTYAPSTAVLTCAKVEGGSSNVSYTFNNNVLTVTASSDAALNETKSFTITPKEGSTATAITIPVTVVAPVALTSISLDPSTAQTIAKDATFPVSVVFTPSDAANKNVTWNIGENDNNVISYKDGIVTGKGRGTVALTATSAVESVSPASINVTVTESIEGTVNVPTETRIGATSISASLNITNGATASDYTVAYSSSDPNVLAVDASTGALTPKTTGTAKITAVLTPTTAGTANGFTGATLESSDITVGAAITATWSGSITNTTITVGNLSTQTMSYPAVTWSETIQNALTRYFVISEDESVVYGDYTLNGNDPTGIALIAKKTGSTNVRVKAEYGTYDYSTNPAIWNPITSSISDPVGITVNALTGEVTLTPYGDITMEITDENKMIGVSRSWSATDATITLAAQSSDPSVAKATLNNEQTQITIDPEAAGEATVTVTSTWKKDFNYPFGGHSATQEVTKTFTVTVTDKEAATSLSVASTADVANGYSTELDVTFAPKTAKGFTVSVTPVDGAVEGKVTAELSADFKSLTITGASDAVVGAKYNVTITPKAGSTASAATVAVTVVDPVGINSITLVPSSADLLVGKKITIVPTFNPENPASKKLTWSSSDETKATVDANGVVTGKARGQVIITATSESINGAAAVTAIATITVKEELAPTISVKQKSTYRLGETWEKCFTLSNPSLGTIAYEISDETVLKPGEDGVITAYKVGTATITGKVTPTQVALDDNYVAWERSMLITVVPAEYGLSLTNVPTSVPQGTGGTVNVTPTVKLNDVQTTKVNDTDYTITYSLEGATEGVSINSTSGVVTVEETAPVQQFCVVGTLTPIGTDADNYTGTTAKASVLVTNSSAKVEISVDADGVYTVYVPSPGAFGSLVENPTVDNAETSYTAHATLMGDATLEGLKAATHIKVTGLLANSDVQELVNVIGRKVSAESEFVTCETLDMGGAQMTEAIVATNTGGNESKCSWLDTTSGACKSLAGVKNLTLPQPAIGVVGGTILPANTLTLVASWYTLSQNALKTLTIPEGWTETAAGFSGYYGHDETVLQKLTALNLPNSLEKIGAYSFSDLRVVTLYMPKNVKRIDTNAFTPSSKLQEIYFTGRAPEYVHTFAFSPQTQMCNNCVEDNACFGVCDPTITRNEYINGGVLACIMRYPKEYESEYIDVTRVYSVLPPTQPYSKGGNPYIPEGWTQAFIDEVKSKTLTYLAPSFLNVDYGVKDRTYGYDFIWPSQSQMTTGYAIAQAGYKWSGDAFDVTTQYDPSATYENGGVDKRGLYQFIVGMGNAPKDKDEWPFKYQQDLWYTIALPFNMSVEEIKKVFGENTQVCRFSNVVRTIETDAKGNTKKKLVLEFRNSVMGEDDGRPDGTQYSDGKFTGIRNRYPYMIKPSGTVDAEDATIKFNPTTGERVFTGYKTETGVLMEDKITVGELNYYFRPIIMEGVLKKNSYVFTNYKGKHQFVFYKGKKNSEGVYVDGGKATANTAYVQLDGTDGAQDLSDFFTETSTSSSKVAINATFLGDDDVVSGIEEVSVACGYERVDDNKVYTINGVLVNGESLAPGLYIRNGKKFIVK